MSALDVCSVCVYICMYVIDNCVYLRLSQRWADQQRDHQKKEKYPPTPSRIEKSLSKPRIPYQIQSKIFYASLDSQPTSESPAFRSASKNYLFGTSLQIPNIGFFSHSWFIPANPDIDPASDKNLPTFTKKIARVENYGVSAILKSSEVYWRSALHLCSSLSTADRPKAPNEPTPFHSSTCRMIPHFISQPCASLRACKGAKKRTHGI
jgi:hypothetical protein